MPIPQKLRHLQVLALHGCQKDCPGEEEQRLPSVKPRQQIDDGCTETVDRDRTTTTDGDAAEAAWNMATTAMRGEHLAKPLLKQLEVLQEMKAAEAAVLEVEIREMLNAAKAIAAGEAGDSGKYEKGRRRKQLRSAGNSS